MLVQHSTKTRRGETFVKKLNGTGRRWLIRYNILFTSHQISWVAIKEHKKSLNYPERCVKSLTQEVDLHHEMQSVFLLPLVDVKEKTVHGHIPHVTFRSLPRLKKTMYFRWSLCLLFFCFFFPAEPYRVRFIMCWCSWNYAGIPDLLKDL